MEQNQELTFYYINKKRGELTLPSYCSYIQFYSSFVNLFHIRTKWSKHIFQPGNIFFYLS
jgi:hypothetical protein